MDYDFIVVGAGFAGSVMAERLATAGRRVLVIDRRSHIGGNAYDEWDAAGVLIHRYGPHVFHTNSERVLAYLSRFTEWRPYEHRVLALVRGKLVPIPINRTTLNTLYGLNLTTEDEVAAFYTQRAEPRAVLRSSEDVVVSRAGRELFELFFEGYTRKQWGLEPSQLDSSVAARIPFRTNDDDRYFTDRYQCMPADGYTAMFERMLDHPRIDVRLETDFRVLPNAWRHHSRLVYTGPIDEFFDWRYGRLPYRSLEFRFTTVDAAHHLPAATVNLPDASIPYTRLTDFNLLTGQVGPVTTIVAEYPTATGDPYYPVPRPENERLYARYKALAEAQSDVVFVGRLATYRYYNMDQVVAQALATAERTLSEEAQAA